MALRTVYLILGGVVLMAIAIIVITLPHKHRIIADTSDSSASASDGVLQPHADIPRHGQSE